MENFAAIFWWFLLLAQVGATVVQVAAWLGLYARVARRRAAQNEPDGQAGPAFSVIVCARNEAANLVAYLPAVLEQRYPDFEVVVVDDASTDDTPAVLRRLQGQYPALRTVRVGHKTHPGKKQALALGVAAARHAHIVVTDADCRPASPHWLAQMGRAFRGCPQAEIVLGIAPFERGAGLLAGWARFETVFTALQYSALTLAGLPYMGVGRNLAWTRAVYDRAGGFSDHLHRASGDDDLLINAAARPGRVALCLDAAAFTYSAAPPGWPAWSRQKRRHLSAAAAYRPAHRIVLGSLALSHTLHYGLGAILLGAQFGIIPVLAGYALRMAAVVSVYVRLLPRWHAADLLPLLPFYDGLLAVYYGAFVPWALHRKKPVMWKL